MDEERQGGAKPAQASENATGLGEVQCESVDRQAVESSSVDQMQSLKHTEQGENEKTSEETDSATAGEAAAGGCDDNTVVKCDDNTVQGEGQGEAVPKRKGRGPDILKTLLTFIFYTQIWRFEKSERRWRNGSVHW